jgi:rare lipoprotein A
VAKTWPAFRRWVVGVGREGYWSGAERVTKMAEWPVWNPPEEMIVRQPYLRRFMAGVLDIPVRAEDCVASVYAVGDSSQPGTKTASGIPLDDNAMTAAHKSLPFGSKVKVTNKKNGHAVTVTIMDRGPYVKGRCIDLSKAGAGALGFAGLAPVSVVPVVSD